MKYIDIHGHINFPQYDVDREAVIARTKDADVGMIIIGTDLESSRRAIELAEKYENIWATVGVHPTDSVGHDHSALVFDHDAFRKLAMHPKVVAIGECGLDYFHAEPTDMAAQRDIFIKHIKLANEINKPLMLHVRNAKVLGENGSAYEEAVAILKLHAKVRADFHFFAGTKEDVQAILDIDGMVSFTGVVTFARSYDDVIKYVPLDRIMSETDCPFVSPTPYRGKRNEPSYVIEVVKAISNIRGDGETAVSKQLLENAVNFFGLK